METKFLLKTYGLPQVEFSAPASNICGSSLTLVGNALNLTKRSFLNWPVDISALKCRAGLEPFKRQKDR